MKKNKEWLKEAIKNSELVSSAKLYDLIDQLDEPSVSNETVSDILDSNRKLSKRIKELEAKLEEPEQEKVVIPQFVADYYETVKHLVLSAQFDKFKYAPDKKVWNWYRECEGEYPNPEANAQLVISMIKLGRYEVEEEKLYIVKLPMSKQNDMGYAMLDAHGDIWVDRYPSRYELTEQEIKAIDERYWAFAEEITK